MKATMKKALCVLVLAVLVVDAISTSTDTLRRRRRRRNFDATKIKAHVFTGYMDEEVTYTLQNVLKAGKQQYSGVIVIERNSFTENKNPLLSDTPVPKDSGDEAQKRASNWLLQRPVSTYSDKEVHVVVPIMTGNKVDNKDIYGAEWAYGSVQKLQGDKGLEETSATVLGNLKTEFQTLFNLPETRKTLYDVWSEKGNFDRQGKPKMSFKGFDATTAAAPLIYMFGQIDKDSVLPLAIVIRAFEMGLNPGAVTPSLALAAHALKKAKVDEFSIFAIGAGGAANAADCAGSFSFLQASWYAGVVMTGHNTVSMTLDFDEVGKADQLVAAVNGDPKPGNLKTAWEARTPKKQGGLDESKYSVEQQKKEKKIVEDFVKGNSDARIGMTYTYFGGWNSKLASNTVHGHSANMEDYHVIKAVNLFLEDAKKPQDKRAFPTLQKEGVWRVDADPYCIKQGHKDELDKWMDSGATVTMGTLVKIWKWNFAGLPLNQLRTAGGCWSMVEEGNGEFKKAFIAIEGSNGCVPNPFLVEMAVDFWVDGGDVDAMFKELGGNVANQKDIKTLVEVVAAKAGEERVAAIKELAHYYCQRTWFIEKSDKRKAPVSTVLLAKKDSDGAAFDGAYNKDTNNDDKVCPLWARGNWAIPPYWKSEDLKKIKEQFDPVPRTYVYFAHWFKGMGSDGVDRLFYKASNFPGIENLNKHLFSGNKSPIDFLSQQKTMANRPTCDENLSKGCPDPN